MVEKSKWRETSRRIVSPDRRKLPVERRRCAPTDSWWEASAVAVAAVPVSDAWVRDDGEAAVVVAVYRVR